MFFFFFQAEDGIRDLVRSRGLGDVYKRQAYDPSDDEFIRPMTMDEFAKVGGADSMQITVTSDQPPYDTYDSVVFRAFNPDDVVQYRLKEELSLIHI